MRARSIQKTAPAPNVLEGWQSTQRLAGDGSVESEQLVHVPSPVVELSEEGARELGEAYWLTVEHVTRGLVRARRSGDGVVLRALGRDLLRFDAPATDVSPDGVRCRYDILGGMLTRRAGGSITFVQTQGPAPALSSTIMGFHPRLAARPGGPRWSGVLYSLVQRRLHLAVSRRYFYRLLAGGSP